MPQKQEKHNSKKHETSSSSDSDSSSSDKKQKQRRERNPRRHRDSSKKGKHCRKETSPKREHYEDKITKIEIIKKERDSSPERRSKESPKRERRERRSCSPKRHHDHKRNGSKSPERSHSSDEDICEDFNAIYEHFKCALLKNDQAMIAGSDCFAAAYDTAAQNIDVSQIATMQYNGLLRDAQKYTPSGEIFVREDGVYAVEFACETGVAAQFSFFVNNEIQDVSTTGCDAGPGELIVRYLIPLRKNDRLSVRNYVSSSGQVLLNVNSGGTQNGVNVNIIMHKIAPYPLKGGEVACKSDVWDEHWEGGPCHWDKTCKKFSDIKCHSEMKKIYHKVIEKMLCDPELMLQGFDVHGSFYSQASQIIGIEQPVLFPNNQSVHCIQHVPGTSDIIIEQDGVYMSSFILAPDVPAQFAIFVNGVSVDSTINGVNRGAGQLTGRQLLYLKKGDIVTLVNHTSAIPVSISANPGGILPGSTAELILIKIAQSCPPKQHDCKCHSHLENEWCAEEFLCYMKYHQKCLQPSGSSCYFCLKTTAEQVIPVGGSVLWDDHGPILRTDQLQGTACVKVEEDGDYYLAIDIITMRPAQYTLFANDKPLLYTTAGRNSGGNRASIRQLVTLCKGDELTVRNWQSQLGSVDTNVNSGGDRVGVNAAFQMIRLSKHFCD